MYLLLESGQCVLSSRAWAVCVLLWAAYLVLSSLRCVSRLLASRLSVSFSSLGFVSRFLESGLCVSFSSLGSVSPSLVWTACLVEYVFLGVLNSRALAVSLFLYKRLLKSSQPEQLPKNMTNTIRYMLLNGFLAGPRTFP